MSESPTADAVVAPLWPGQARLYVIQRTVGALPVYQVPLYLRAGERLDPDAVARAVRAVAERHSVLRTRFIEADGETYQRIEASADPPAAVIAATDAGIAALDDGVRAVVTSTVAEPFDLAAAPLFRYALIQGRCSSLLCLVFHHTLVDAESLRIIAGDLDDAYRALRAGVGSPFSEPAPQYADFVLRQARENAAGGNAASLAYWREQLADLPAPANLPADHHHGSPFDAGGGHAGVRIDAEVATALREIASREGASLNMAFVAATALLVARYCGNDDVVLGMPLSLRDEPNLDGVVGFFVNTVPLRVRVARNGTFRELLRSVRNVVLDAFDHGAVPLNEISRAAARTDPSRPLFTAYLHFVPARAHGGEPARLLVPIDVEVDTRTAKFPLGFFCTQTSSGAVDCTLQFATATYAPDTIARAARHLATLLRSAVREPDVPVDRLELTTADDVADAASAPHGPHVESCGVLHRILDETVSRAPERIAVQHRDGTLTYHELRARAVSVAGAIARFGLAPEARVAVITPRSLDLLPVLYGVLLAGCAYVAIEHDVPPQRLEWMLSESAAELVLCEAVRELPAAVPQLTFEAALAALDAVAGHEPRANVLPQDLAYVFFTSGSTGNPKAVGIEHRNASSLVTWCARAIPEFGERVLAATPVGFDVSIFELFVTLAAGGTVVLVDDISAAVQASLGVSVVSAVPSALQAVLAESVLPDTVRVVTSAGEAVRRSLVDRVFAQLPHVRFVNLYGATEDTTHSTIAVYESPADAVVAHVGRSIGGRRLYVLDDHLNAVPRGAIGEIYLAGTGLARGYLGRPRLTAERFVPDRFAGGGARMYQTGDYARFRHDGTIEYLGRRDRQVKFHGVRLELAELESVLVTHPRVREAVVVPFASDAGGAHLCAYAAVSGRTEGTEAELRAFLAERIPRRCLPSAISIVENLPHTPSGKIAVRLLRPPPARVDAASRTVAPLDALTLRVRAIFADILRTPELGADANYFEAGGDSLGALGVMARIGRELGIELPLASLIEAPTPVALAGTIARAGTRAARWSPAVALENGTAPPFFMIHGAGGNVARFWHLARALRGACSVVGLQARGFGAGEEPIATIDAMTDEYAAAIGDRVPRGPVYLGGWCMGATLAFETARKLAARDREVALLALMLNPAPKPYTIPPTRAGMLEWFAHHHGLPGYVAPAGADPEAQTADLLRRMRDAGILPAYVERGYFERFVHVFETNVRATHGYVPGRYEGRALFFPLAEDIRGTDPSRGWISFVAALDVVPVGGDHDSMLRAPHVGTVATAVETVLTAPFAHAGAGRC